MIFMFLVYIKKFSSSSGEECIRCAVTKTVFSIASGGEGFWIVLGEEVASEDEGFVEVASEKEGLVGAIPRTGFGRVAYAEEVGAAAMSACEWQPWADGRHQ